MRSTGIVRKIDHLGRFVIPKELRTVFDLEEEDGLEILIDGDTIVLRKYAPRCNLCETVRATISFKSKLLCPECIQTIREAGR